MGIESAEKVDQTSSLSDWLILLQINILTVAKLKMDMYVWEKQKIRNSTLMLLSLLLAMWRANRFTETKIFTNQYDMCRESCSDFLILR